MRLLLLTASFLILISGAAYSAYWFYAAGRVGVALNGWSDGDGPLGLTLVSETTPQIRGFPFDFTITLGPTKVTDTSRWPGTAVNIPGIVSWSHPWSPHDWRFAALQGANVSGKNIDSTQIKIQSLDGEVHETSGEQGRIIAITASATRIEGKYNDTPVNTERFSLDLSVPETQPQAHGAESLAFAVELEDMKLPKQLKPLDQTITHISLVGALDGVIPRKPLPEALGAWRDSGGTIEIHHMKLAWGALSMTGNGTLALDKTLQPMGAFSTQISNYGDIIDAMAGADIIKPTEASYIQVGLALLAKKDEEGHPFLKTPVTLQNDSLYIGPAKLAKLPQIDWQ